MAADRRRSQAEPLPQRRRGLRSALEQRSGDLRPGAGSLARRNRLALADDRRSRRRPSSGFHHAIVT
jgi:hypothetical protein